jgi:hypothetical protein
MHRLTNLIILVMYSTEPVEDDRFNAVKKQGWYIGHGLDGPIASLEPFRHCPWCSKKLAKPKL